MFYSNLPEHCSIVGKWTMPIFGNYKFRSTPVIKDTRIFTGIFAIILLFSVPLVVPSQAVLTDPSQTGVIIPLYTYPGNTWDEVIQVKNANPSIPIIAIINPNSGSGSSIDTNYETKIQELQSAEILVLGYVYTSYAQRNSAQAITEIDNYKNWYNVDGIFFDEMSNTVGDENYYQNLDDYVKSQGLSYTVGNPGADTLPSYVGTVDNIIIYENSGLPDVSLINGWHENYEKKNFSLLTHELNAIDSAFCVEASNYVGYLYMTNDILPNPWDSLPPYFDELVAKMNTSIDSVPPVITLNGDNPITLEAGIDTYTEDGASVTDDDPTYTGTVSIGGDTVYANTVGTYIVTYDAPADAAGNVPAQVTRTVIVKEIVIIAETTFCDDLTIDELIASGVYNVIDNRDGHLDGTVIIGTDGKDMILASNAGNQIRAMGGSDCVIGGAGNDVLYGNRGSDKMFGQLGDDLLRGNRGSDTIVGGSGDDILKGGPNTDTCISDIEDTTAPNSCEFFNFLSFSSMILSSSTET